MPVNYCLHVTERAELLGQFRSMPSFHSPEYSTGILDKETRPILECEACGYGVEWQLRLKNYLESLAPTIDPRAALGTFTKLLPYFDVVRTEAGTAVIRTGRFDSPELRRERPAEYWIETITSCAQGPKAVADATASASVGDVTISPTIVVNPAPPVVTVQVTPPQPPPPSLANVVADPPPSRGKNPELVLSLLRMSHGYSDANRRLDNETPLAVKDIATKLHIGDGSASRALDAIFPEANGKKGHKRYVALCRAGESALRAALTAAEGS